MASRKRKRPCEDGRAARSLLLDLPVELSSKIFAALAEDGDARSLARLEVCSKRHLLGRGELAAQALLQRFGETKADRHGSWLESLMWQAAGCGFDHGMLAEAGFAALLSGGKVSRVGLPRLGPRLLVSDRSTADQCSLRWRLQVRGRNACVEFGVIPTSLLDEPGVLQRALGSFGEQSIGFSSHIVSGSRLPIKAVVLQNSVVEVLARRGHVEYIITNPRDCLKLAWENGQPRTLPYRGGDRMRFQHSFAADEDVRLALTCWQHGSFEVLHTVASPPPQRQQHPGILQLPVSPAQETISVELPQPPSSLLAASPEPAMGGPPASAPPARQRSISLDSVTFDGVPTPALLPACSECSDA